MFHFYTSLKRNKTSGFQIFLFVFFMGGGGGGDRNGTLAYNELIKYQN